ncbi:MAG: (5-formylfuran-3-yl)methyl phosphate synthase [Planctomycetia bacterium]|nr:(5-formylfuran-3-yl)methyl phosphate synthase [Planctomycetia bacterium]
MIRLLISVRNAEEAQVALAGGADLIDVKEPNRGSLGAADALAIKAVVREVAGRVSVSAALGELLWGNRLDASLAGQLQYAKFGLAGCGIEPDWTTRWKQAIAQLPEGITPVAVAYADWKSALAPEPREVLEYAQAFECGAVLVDTYDKTHGSLLEHWALADLGRFVNAVRQRSLLCVMAGGLGLAEISELLPLAPDYIAVRGAACRGDRTGRLDIERIRRLAAVVHFPNRAESPVGSM